MCSLLAATALFWHCSADYHEAELFGVRPLKSSAHVGHWCLQGGKWAGCNSFLQSSQGPCRHLAGGSFLLLSSRHKEPETHWARNWFWGTGELITAELSLSPLLLREFCECFNCPCAGAEFINGTLWCLQFFYISWDSWGKSHFLLMHSPHSLWSTDFTQRLEPLPQSLVVSIEAVADSELILSRMPQCFL